MQFNSHSDNQDIVSHIVDATGLNPVAHIKTIARAANEALRLIWSWIFEAYGGWQFDDANHENLPSATTALVASQGKYTILAEAITIKGFSVVDQAGNEHDLDPITLEDIAARGLSEAEFLSIPGDSKYYRLVGNLVRLYPAPSYSQAASLRVKFDRGSVQFASTDTTKAPGFAAEFHGAVPAGGSYFIAVNKNHKNTDRLERRWLSYEQPIKSFYKRRLAELAPESAKTSFEDPAAYLI